MLVSGRPFQKHPVSSIFHTSSGFYSLVISLTRSFQLSSTFSFTSPSSPAVFILWRLCFFLKDCSHPFDAEKPLISILSAIRRAFSFSIVLDTGMFGCLQRLYHSHNASFTSEYFAGRTLLMTRLHACLILGQNLLLGTQNFLGLCQPFVEFVWNFTITCVWIILCIVYQFHSLLQV